MDAAKKTTTEKRIVIALLGLFALTLTGSLKNVLSPGSGGGGAISAPAVGHADVPKTVPEMLSAYQAKMEPKIDTATTGSPDAKAPTASALYTAQTLRDPMDSLLPKESPKPILEQTAVRSAPELPPAPPSLRVRGILWGGKDAQAIINDKVYRVGDTVAGVKILSIDRRGVTVEYRGMPMRYTTAAPATDAERTPAQQARWR